LVAKSPMIQMALTSDVTDWPIRITSPRIGKRWFRFSQISGALGFGLPRQWKKRNMAHRFNSASSGMVYRTWYPDETQISCTAKPSKVWWLEEELESSIPFIWLEVAKAVQAIASAESLNSADLIQIKAWFSDYFELDLHTSLRHRRAGQWQ